jgi:hypothetical protein
MAVDPYMGAEGFRAFQLLSAPFLILMRQIKRGRLGKKYFWILLTNMLH